jgi:hypothetical protein
VFTGEKKEEREEIREMKKEKNIVVQIVCLCLRFFFVQINLQEFNQ